MIGGMYIMQINHHPEVSKLGFLDACIDGNVSRFREIIVGPNYDQIDALYNILQPLMIQTREMVSKVECRFTAENNQFKVYGSGDLGKGLSGCYHKSDTCGSDVFLIEFARTEEG